MSDQSQLKLKVLYIDDEPDILEVFSETIESAGYDPLVTSSLEEARTFIRTYQNELVMIFCDFKMPESNGIEFRESINDEFIDIPFAIITGFINKEMALEGIKHKICAVIDKPADTAQIREVIKKEASSRASQLQEEFELLQGFFEESELLMEEIEPLILDLEQDPHDLSPLDRAFAIIHTIKGVSGFFKPDYIHRFSHRFEDFLTQVKNGFLRVDPENISRMLQSLDVIKQMIESIKTKDGQEWDVDEHARIFELQACDDPPPVKAEPGKNAADLRGKAKKSGGRDEIRVATQLLDEFMGLSGEITVLRNMINKTVVVIEKEFRGNPQITYLGTLLDEMNKINQIFQEKVVNLRKLPIKGVYRPLKRIVRDLCQKLDREINIEFVGEGLRADTSIIEVLNNSLVHMLRNSVDHGIEPPGQRIAANKSPVGNIKISAYEETEVIRVVVQDDGRGIDVEKIKAMVLEKGIRSVEEVESMKEMQILNLIFEPGFSTAVEVTDVSGRGVGTDMVKSSIDQIGGSIETHTEIGKGTTFTLNLPIPKSVLIISSLLVRCKHWTVGIPQDRIFYLLTVEPSEAKDSLREMESCTVLQLNDTIYPIVSLTRTFGLTDQLEIPEGSPLEFVIVESKVGRYAILVDEILDLEDIIVKKLNRSFKDISFISGATFLDDSNVGLILDMDGVAEANGMETLIENTQAKEDRNSGLAINSTPTEKNKYTDQDYFLEFELDVPGAYSVPMKEVYRLERISSQSIQYLGKQKVVLYRGATMPLIKAEKLISRKQIEESKNSWCDEFLSVLVFQFLNSDRFFGVVIKKIVDLRQAEQIIDNDLQKDRGILANLIYGKKSIALLDCDILKSKAAKAMGAAVEEAQANRQFLDSKTA